MNTVKHGGGNIMILGCLSFNEEGALDIIDPEQTAKAAQKWFVDIWNGLADRQTWFRVKNYGEYWKKIKARRLSNLKELKIFSNEEWDKILLNVART